MTRDGEPTPMASAHLLRFGAAMTILVAVSLAGVALEQRSLGLSRKFSLQTFRADRLEHEAAELRLKIEQLQTPQRLMEVTRRADDFGQPDSSDAAGAPRRRQ